MLIQVKDLPKGFHPSGVNRKSRRDNSEVGTNNRKGIARIHAFQMPGQRPSKVNVVKQYVGNKLIVHYL